MAQRWLTYRRRWAMGDLFLGRYGPQTFATALFVMTYQTDASLSRGRVGPAPLAGRPKPINAAAAWTVIRLSVKSIMIRSRVSPVQLIWITVIARHPERLDNSLPGDISIGDTDGILSVTYSRAA